MGRPAGLQGEEARESGRWQGRAVVPELPREIVRVNEAAVET